MNCTLCNDTGWAPMEVDVTTIKIGRATPKLYSRCFCEVGSKTFHDDNQKVIEKYRDRAAQRGDGDDPAEL